MKKALRIQYGIFMKKALNHKDEPHLYEKDGKIYSWHFTIEEVLEAVNSGNKEGWGENVNEAVKLKGIYEWICRYLEEGVTLSLIHI